MSYGYVGGEVKQVAENKKTGTQQRDAVWKEKLGNYSWSGKKQCQKAR